MSVSVEDERIMSLVDSFKRVYAFKSPDVEEWIDMYWHRPLAAVVALVFLPTPVGPNAVTVLSLLTGLAGSVALGWSIHTGEPQWRWLAGLLVFLSVVFDCADGQLARAKGGGTRWGRILDGLVDAIVLLTLYVTIFVDVLVHYGTTWATVAFFAGWIAGLRIYIYDKLKSIYLSFVQPAESDGGESIEVAEREWERVKAEGTWKQKVGMFIYVRMLLSAQEALVPAPKEIPEMNDEGRQAFRDRHIGAVRLFTLLGLGTHMFFIYTAVAFSAISTDVMLGLQVLFIGPYNLFFAYVLWRTKAMRRGDGAIAAA